MTYSIAQVAEKTRLTPYTLRYYDREGLLPFVARNLSGIRMFTDHDLEMLSVICCLKSTGMPIKQIRTFIDWYVEGNGTLEMRRAMFAEHRINILSQMDELQKNLNKVDQKLAYYDAACAAYKNGSPMPVCVELPK